MTFIQKYLDYASPQTGAPRQYHFYAAYAILSTLIGRRATYHGAGGAKGPNLWMVILGPSSMAYKSTVTNIAVGLLRNYYEPLAKEVMIPSSGSYESFVEALVERPQGIMVNDEFVSIMDWINKDYNGELLGLLTKLYDYGAKTFTRRVGTRSKAQTYTITEPFINAFYCSTFEWFNDKMSEKLVMGGFIPRHILVHVNEPSREIPRTPPADLLVRDSLLGDMEVLDKIPFGQMDYTEQAGRAFDEWFMEYVPRVTKDASAMLQPVIRRRLTDTHKFAMIHAALRGSPNEMTLTDLETAMTITENLVQNAAEILTGKITMNPFQASRQKVLDIIEKLQSRNGVEGSPRQFVIRYAKMSARELDQIIETLESEDMITVTRSKVSGKSAVHYKLTEDSHA